MPEDDLTVCYSQPRWLADYWEQCYGRENTVKMFEWFLREQPLTVRCAKTGDSGNVSEANGDPGGGSSSESTDLGSFFPEGL